MEPASLAMKMLGPEMNEHFLLQIFGLVVTR